VLGGMQVVAQVPRASARQSSAILSSIEFDHDATLFATAGVSKRISIFDFATVSWHWPTACSVLTADCMLITDSAACGHARSSVQSGGGFMLSRHDIWVFRLQVMRNPLETQHRPHAEISTRSKLSCLSWNRYLRPHIISSDYEGAHHPI
jgi:E3 ubiquitin-protein ligase RFWD2